MNSVETKIFDASAVRADFPILDQTIHKSRPLIYFDNGASTQRPSTVIAAMKDCYERTYANVHRGIHWLSEQASEQYELARSTVATFIGAPDPVQVIFTSGTTASLNLVARSWGEANLHRGDEILLTMMEHHSNIVPWQQLAEKLGAKVVWVGLSEDGHLDLDELRTKLNSRTKIFAFAAVSNVLGTINPVKDLVQLAREAGAISVVDAAQHVPHERTDVMDWDADFVAFSGHKMLAPSGIGILYGRRDLLETMPAFHGGGSMISSVTVDGHTLGELPAKFEAGTPPIAQAIGMGAAVDYLAQFDLQTIAEHERRLATKAHGVLSKIDGLKILGPAPTQKDGIVSFVVDGCSTQDVALFLDRQGIAIRAGHHCAMPLHDYLGLRNSCRASFYLYNTESEVERFGDTLDAVIQKLR